MLMIYTPYIKAIIHLWSLAQGDLINGTHINSHMWNMPVSFLVDQHLPPLQQNMIPINAVMA